MSERHFGILVWTACAISWSAVWVPALVHLSMTWYRGRNRVFKQLCSEEIRLYYAYFAPTEMPPPGVPVSAYFEKQFARIYGRRRYLIPLGFLIVISGVGFCAMARTIQAWQGSAIWSPFSTAAQGEKVVTLPSIAVAAFLGAFTWVVLDQLQRLRNNDLTQHDVAIAVLRFLVAIPFGYAFSSLATPSFGVPLAFLLGTFPTGVIMKAGQRLIVQKLPAMGEDTTREEGNELESLQCVSRSNAERFMEEGINTISELANADPIDLALRTNQSFDYVIDCSAQALVWVYFTDKARVLMKYSLRSAYEVTELVERLDSKDTNDRKAAESVLRETSQLLDMQPDSLRHTLTLIERAPFTRFLVDLSHKRFPRRSRPDGHKLVDTVHTPSEHGGAPRPLPHPVEPSSQTQDGGPAGPASMS